MLLSDGILLVSFKEEEKINNISCVENYVHEDSYAMSSSHFGKRQTTLLVAVVFFKETIIVDGEEHSRLVKKYYDFVSEYLGHNNNIFYIKCMAILLDELKTDVPFEFTKLYNVTDGGSHFVSRYAFWDLGRTSRLYSKLIYLFLF